jgi:hypothetical protein
VFSTGLWLSSRWLDRAGPYALGRRRRSTSRMGSPIAIPEIRLADVVKAIDCKAIILQVPVL